MSNTYPNLGKYQILEELGRGGMGAVYKGYDPFLKRMVAIKLLAPHLVWEKAFVERFLREARAVAQLNHPNIIDIYDVGQDGPNHYFVMAFMSGPSLSRLIKQRGRFALTDAITILQQVGKALDYAHSKGMVHRDVKPANVMFDEHGQAILTDFGIVKAAEQARLTGTGAAIGTPHYMAPEQVQGAEIDARTDQYALGIIAFELLSGRVPFDATTTTAILYKHVNEPLPSIVASCPDLPPALEGVLNRALAKTPAERFASCEEFVQALEHALTQPHYAAQPAPRSVERTQRYSSEPPATPTHTAQPTPPPPPRPTQQPTRKAKPAQKRGTPVWALAIGGIVLLACLIGTGIFITSTLINQANQSSAVSQRDLALTQTAQPATQVAEPTQVPIPTAQILTPVLPSPTTLIKPLEVASPTSPPSPPPSATPLPSPTNPPPPPTSVPTNTPPPTPVPSTPTPTPVPAQPAQDRITGRFTYRGASVAGIPVALIASSECDKNAVVQQTNTDAQGRYTFQSVNLGSYRIAINGWNGIAAPLEPYEQTCTWALDKTNDTLTLDWTLHKTDLQINSPSNNATINSTTPTLSWNAYDGATRYEVILLQTSPSRQEIEWNTPTQATSFTSSTSLTSGARYNLLVWAWDASGQIAVGQIYFQVQ